MVFYSIPVVTTSTQTLDSIQQITQIYSNHMNTLMTHWSLSLTLLGIFIAIVTIAIPVISRFSGLNLIEKRIADLKQSLLELDRKIHLMQADILLHDSLSFQGDWGEVNRLVQALPHLLDAESEKAADTAKQLIYTIRKLAQDKKPLPLCAHHLLIPLNELEKKLQHVTSISSATKKELITSFRLFSAKISDDRAYQI